MNHMDCLTFKLKDPFLHLQITQCDYYVFFKCHNMIKSWRLTFFWQLKVHVDERPGETVTFRKLLLNQCQKEFEKDKLEELDLEKMSKQIEEATSVGSLGSAEFVAIYSRV